MHEFIVVLIRCSAVTGVTVLIALALRRPLRRWFGAQAAYRLWLLVPIATGAALLPAPAQPIGGVLGVMAMSTLSAPIAAISTAPAFDPQLLLLCIWLIGALVTLAGFVLQQRRYLRNLGGLSGIDARTLRAESSNGCPALVGALRPRVVLPRDFETRYAPRECELVLAHERTHLRRGDAQINALVAALRCLQWFNPLIHFAASCFRFDQELACDAVVISRFPEARRCYADAMLKTQLAGEAWQELR
jgi:beta-lactamase regulating signal transducer with metallopeptidase domain